MGASYKMGINTNGSNIVWKAQNVTTRELRKMLDKHENIRLDVDVSNIAHILLQKSSTYQNLIQNVALYLKDLAHITGFYVTGILDGDVRPHSKRDSFRRRFVSEMKKINSSYCRQKAMALSTKENTLGEDLEKIKVLNEESRKLDQKRLNITHEFLGDLHNMLNDIDAFDENPTSGGKVNNTLIKAKFQADYIMSYRYQHMETDLLLSTDMDFSALAGPRCLMIRNYHVTTQKDQTGNKRKKNIEKITNYVFTIGGGSNTHMEELKNMLGDLSTKSKIQWTSAAYPILDLSNYYLRSLFVVSIGCDAYKGFNGVTPKWIFSEYDKVKNEEDIYNSMTTKILEKSKNLISSTDLFCYVMSFMFEPAVEIEKSNDISSYKYLFESPKVLPKYLEHFVHKDSKIEILDNHEHNPVLLECKGICNVNQKHVFLASENHYTCSKCNEVFCSTCGYAPDKDRNRKKKKTPYSNSYFDDKDKPLCLDCYRTDLFLPLGADVMVMSNKEMIRILKENNHQIGDDTPPHTIQEMYDLYLTNQNYRDNLKNRITFPLLPAKSLKQIDLIGEELLTFNIINGGQFINDKQNICNETLLQVIDLIASFLKIQPGYKHVHFKDEIFNVIPKMFVDFANGCRVDSGYRLLERCLRHCFDNKAEPIINKKATFLKTQSGELAIILRNKVPASMKDDCYEVETCCTKDILLACTCTCKSGGKEEEKIACVHNIPVLYQFTMLLHAGLADNILVELAERWNSTLDTLVVDNILHVKENIMQMMMMDDSVDVEATGMKTSTTISEMLQKYAVTTQKSNLKIPPKPDPNELIPLRNLNIISLAKKGKMLIQKNTKKKLKQ